MSERIGQSRTVFRGSRSTFTQPRMSRSAAADGAGLPSRETFTGFCRLTPYATLALTACERVLAGGCLLSSSGASSEDGISSFVGSHCVLCFEYGDAQRGMRMKSHASSSPGENNEQSSVPLFASPRTPVPASATSLSADPSLTSTSGRPSSFASCSYAAPPGFPPVVRGNPSSDSLSCSKGRGCLPEKTRREADEASLFWCSVEKETRGRLEKLGFEDADIEGSLACCRSVRRYQMRSLSPCRGAERVSPADQSHQITSSKNTNASADGSTALGRSVLVKQRKEDSQRHRGELRAVGHLLRSCVEVICATAAAREGASEVLAQPGFRPAGGSRECSVVKEFEKLRALARKLEASLGKRRGRGSPLPESFREPNAVVQLRKTHECLLREKLLETVCKQSQVQRKTEGGQRSSSEDGSGSGPGSSFLPVRRLTEEAAREVGPPQDPTWPSGLLVPLRSLGILKSDLTDVLADSSQNSKTAPTATCSLGGDEALLPSQGTSPRSASIRLSTASTNPVLAEPEAPSSTWDAESVYTRVLRRILACADSKMDNVTVESPVSKDFGSTFPWGFTEGTGLSPAPPSAGVAETGIEEEVMALRAIFGDEAIRHFPSLSLADALLLYQPGKVLVNDSSDVTSACSPGGGHVIEVDVDSRCSFAVHLYASSSSEGSGACTFQSEEDGQKRKESQGAQRTTWMYPAHPPVLLWLRHPTACVLRRRQVTLELLSSSMRSWRHAPMLFEWITVLQEWSRSTWCYYEEEATEHRTGVPERTKRAEVSADCLVGKGPEGGGKSLVSVEEQAGEDREAQQWAYAQCSLCSNASLEGTGAGRTHKSRDQSYPKDGRDEAEDITTALRNAQEESGDFAGSLPACLDCSDTDDCEQDNSSTVDSVVSRAAQATVVEQSKAMAAARRTAAVGARRYQGNSGNNCKTEPSSSTLTSLSTGTSTETSGRVLASTRERLEKQKQEAAVLAETRAARIAHLKALLEQEKERDERENPRQAAEHQDDDVRSEEDDQGVTGEQESDHSDGGVKPEGEELGESQTVLLEKLQAEDQQRLSDLIQATREESEKLRSAWKRRADPFQQRRRELPVYAHREEFLQGLQQQQVGNEEGQNEDRHRKKNTKKVLEAGYGVRKRDCIGVVYCAGLWDRRSCCIHAGAVSAFGLVAIHTGGVITVGFLARLNCTRLEASRAPGQSRGKSTNLMQWLSSRPFPAGNYFVASVISMHLHFATYMDTCLVFGL